MCKMLDNSDTDELDLDDCYPEDGLKSILEDCSGEGSEARSRFSSTPIPCPSSMSREIGRGRGIEPGGDEPRMNLTIEKFE